MTVLVPLAHRARLEIFEEHTKSHYKHLVYYRKAVKGEKQEWQSIKLVKKRQ